MITQNAKGLISIIAFEVRLADQRCAGGFIKQGNLAGIIYERLATQAKSNVDLQTFLNTLAFIPECEDEDRSLEWAKDLREPSAHVVDRRTGQSNRGAGGAGTPLEDDRPFPVPGERVC